jgi:hypothetical protein
MTADWPLPCSLAGNPAISITVALASETGGFASPSYDGFALWSATSRPLGRKSCKLSRPADVCNRRRCEPGFRPGPGLLTRRRGEMRRSNPCCARNNKHPCLKLCLSARSAQVRGHRLAGRGARMGRNRARVPGSSEGAACVGPVTAARPKRFQCSSASEACTLLQGEPRPLLPSSLQARLSPTH